MKARELIELLSKLDPEQMELPVVVEQDFDNLICEVDKIELLDTYYTVNTTRSVVVQYVLIAHGKEMHSERHFSGGLQL